MTTRAGWTGILLGLGITGLLYWLVPPESCFELPNSNFWLAWNMIGLLAVGGGVWAAWQSKAVSLWRRVLMGSLASGMAGSLVYGLWGAATAGCTALNTPLEREDVTIALAWETTVVFLAFFAGGGALGGIGGGLYDFIRPARQNGETFDKSAPQMALNVSITAVPASIVAAALAAAVFLPLDAWNPITRPAAWPLGVALLLVLLSQTALTWVIPHETRQAEHRCGTDEVKMAAFVGIGAAPLLLLLLAWVKASLLLEVPVLACLLISTALSLRCLVVLRKEVLPRRASFALHSEDWQRTEAKWFGTIANSQGPRLVMLCAGCGWVMVMPLYVCVLSLWINISRCVEFAYAPPSPTTLRQLYGAQALTSGGLIAASVLVLSLIYIFYLNLGRWFSRLNARRTSPS